MAQREKKKERNQAEWFGHPWEIKESERSCPLPPTLIPPRRWRLRPFPEGCCIINPKN